MKKRPCLALLASIIIVLIVVITGGCHSNSAEKLKMKVLVADSLILPFQEIEKSFELEYPGIDVLTEGHGSIQAIRTITEIRQEADAVLVADNQLIPLLMYSSRLPDQSTPYADWYISFATNELGIAYRPQSRYAGEISAANWYQVLARPDVRLGLSNPLIDALAYRALMCVQLSECYYGDDAIFERFFEGCFKLPMMVETTAEKTVIHIPESMQPQAERIRLRGYNLQILSLLEAGEVDYAFEYQSVARQHGLQFLKLPAEINLGSVELSSVYQTVSVKLDFQRFASVLPEFEGKYIIYGATIPANAPHPLQAVSYLIHVLGNEGQTVLKNNFQPPLVPAWADHPERIPNNLVSWVE